MTEARAVQVRIAGTVQGVGYRAFVERQAVARGLSGWVRNRRDGTVEAVFSGDRLAVEAMLADCREGPRLARVTSVDVIAEMPLISGPFQVAPSA